MYYHGYMLSSQQHARYVDQGSGIDHFISMKSYWGENISVCMLEVEHSVQNSVQFWTQTQTDLLQPPMDRTPPCCPPLLAREPAKHRHRGTSAKAGFWMTVSRKCSGTQSLRRKTPQKRGPGSLT